MLVFSLLNMMQSCARRIDKYSRSSGGTCSLFSGQPLIPVSIEVLPCILEQEKVLENRSKWVSFS